MGRWLTVRWIRLITAALLLSPGAVAQVNETTKQLSRDIFRELIEINTTDSAGDNTAAARAVEKRFLAAGFAREDVKVLVPEGRPAKGNLVVRLHGVAGSQLKPILLLGHLDVVEAKREDWTTNPFEFVEKDGYYYGRGTEDMKGFDAVMITALLRFKQEGYTPSRDLILALTSDEEGGTANGVDWLLKNHRALVDAAFVLNGDAGGVTTDNGKAIDVGVAAAEKLYADFQLTVTNPGGHSSRPTPGNAIYQLAEALGRLAHAPFPFELNPVTRVYFEKIAAHESPQNAADMKAILLNPPNPDAIRRISADPRYNSLLHTTCVATRLNAGHANNALPQTAQAVVNCRILPGHSPEEVRQELIRKLADPKVAVGYMDGAANAVLDHAPDKPGLAPSAPTPEIMKPLERLADSLWPGAGIVPNMETGASDSKYTMAAGMPSFGTGEIAIERNDHRLHGKDERIRVSSFYQAVDFFDRYLRALTAVH
jgi:acetylornithine deacetylase/succinyl-diaminopimelate desuccinylase-like protein